MYEDGSHRIPQEKHRVNVFSRFNLATIDFHAFHRVKRIARPAKNRFTGAGSLPSTRRATSPVEKCFQSTRQAPSPIAKSIRSTRRGLFTHCKVLSEYSPSTFHSCRDIPEYSPRCFTRCRELGEASPRTFHPYRKLSKYSSNAFYPCIEKCELLKRLPHFWESHS